jgi:Na+/H+ antiporter NhaD/arsenite permease-like protein
VIAVAFCMVTCIVTIKEGLQGFANEGVLMVKVRTHACCTGVSLRCIAFCLSWVLYGTPLILKSIQFFSSLLCLGFVVVHGLTMTGAVYWYVGKLLGHPKTLASAQLWLIGSVTFISAFLNNTPIVAVLIPIVIC